MEISCLPFSQAWLGIPALATAMQAPCLHILMPQHLEDWGVFYRQVLGGLWFIPLSTAVINPHPHAFENCCGGSRKYPQQLKRPQGLGFK